MDLPARGTALFTYSYRGTNIAIRTHRRPSPSAADLSVVLLHQSPLSSRRFAAVLPFLATWCVPYAPDTPDYGLSSHTSGDWDVGKYVDAIGAFVSNLPQGRVWIFGRATGAVMAYELFRKLGDRLAGCIFYGLPVYTADEKRIRLEGFANPYSISGTGAHLEWIWRRIYAEYPWIEPELATSMVQDYLAAGPDFARAYRAIWRYEMMPLPLAAQERCWVLGGGRDRLAHMFDRAKALLPAAKTCYMPDATDFVADRQPQRFSTVLKRLVVGGAPDEG